MVISILFLFDFFVLSLNNQFQCKYAIVWYSIVALNELYLSRQVSYDLKNMFIVKCINICFFKILKLRLQPQFTFHTLTVLDQIVALDELYPLGKSQIL